MYFVQFLKQITVKKSAVFLPNTLSGLGYIFGQSFTNPLPKISGALVERMVRLP